MKNRILDQIDNNLVWEPKDDQETSELKLKISKLENLNYILDARLEEESSKRVKLEKALIRQSKMIVGELMSMISHQWTQPLTGLNTLIQNIFLRSSLGKLDKEYLDKQQILTNTLVDKMRTSLADFTNFFQSKKEKLSFSTESAIQSTFFLLDSCFKKNNVKVTKNTSVTAKIYGFENELSQVIFKILLNSRDAFIRNEVKNPSINIRTKKSDTNIQIFIVDNGGGIDENIIEKIFEPYFTTKENYNGVGLGLYVSQTIIEKQMYGKLSVKNVPQGVETSINLHIYKE